MGMEDVVELACNLVHWTTDQFYSDHSHVSSRNSSRRSYCAVPAVRCERERRTRERERHRRESGYYETDVPLGRRALEYGRRERERRRYEHNANYFG